MHVRHQKPDIALKRGLFYSVFLRFQALISSGPAASFYPAFTTRAVNRYFQPELLSRTDAFRTLTPVCDRNISAFPREGLYRPEASEPAC